MLTGHARRDHETQMGCKKEPPLDRLAGLRDQKNNVTNPGRLIRRQCSMPSAWNMCGRLNNTTLRKLISVFLSLENRKTAARCSDP